MQPAGHRAGRTPFQPFYRVSLFDPRSQSGRRAQRSSRSTVRPDPARYWTEVVPGPSRRQSARGRRRSDPRLSVATGLDVDSSSRALATRPHRAGRVSAPKAPDGTGRRASSDLRSRQFRQDNWQIVLRCRPACSGCLRGGAPDFIGLRGRIESGQKPAFALIQGSADRLPECQVVGVMRRIVPPQSRIATVDNRSVQGPGKPQRDRRPTREKVARPRTDPVRDPPRWQPTLGDHSRNSCREG